MESNNESFERTKAGLDLCKAMIQLSDDLPNKDKQIKLIDTAKEKLEELKTIFEQLKKLASPKPKNKIKKVKKK